MNKIRWGIIGCGDVTEVKSGPAFNKVKNSELVAVMRRDGEKAKDYAFRHQVPKWYTSAEDLIHDPDVNAIYIATPPSVHEEFAIAAFNAGKPVYVEKPMSVDAVAAGRIAKAAKEKNIKLAVAHYRRAQPFFKKIKQLISEKIIGEILFARSELYKRSLSPEELKVPKTAWRVDPSIAGGGLFHDLSPHQLDLMYYFFGTPRKAFGIGLNQGGLYNADDLVAGNILFESGVVFDGLWCFNAPVEHEKDRCEIIGERGTISFSFFEHHPLEVTVDGKTENLLFEPLQHVQQPMIEKVVEYFLDEGPNPCSGEEGTTVMKLIDDFSGKVK
ncbi:MAG TPA: Gfo/Idh/MocA family oxidoreductase [Chitinophagaceae bacterium]|nr:Gfo/Idh/MocA family oxidoreductase [Chitinophagaceae bacterium]